MNLSSGLLCSLGNETSCHLGFNMNYFLDCLLLSFIFYRPIEGTIFRSYVNYKDYLKSHYKVSMDMCVPKPHYLLAGHFRNKPSYCNDIRVPCSWLDFMYPRLYTFTLPNSSYFYEVGFESNPNGSCKMRSIYYYRKDW